MKKRGKIVMYHPWQKEGVERALALYAKLRKHRKRSAYSIERIFPKPSWTYCHYCGGIIIRNEMTRDHIDARIKGGRNERSNLVFACFICNFLKNDMEYFEFKYLLRIFTEAFPIQMLKAKNSGWKIGGKTPEPIKELQKKFVKFISKEKSRLAAADSPISSLSASPSSF